ncbi:MAG: hypothetical protein AAGL17_02675, partial [Cyanobacteria bacterium J06576_12]
MSGSVDEGVSGLVGSVGGPTPSLCAKKPLSYSLALIVCFPEGIYPGCAPLGDRGRSLLASSPEV